MGIEVLEVNDISGGVRQDVPIKSMPANSFTRIVNMEYDIDGGLQKRNGQAVFNAAALSGTLDNGIRFYRESSGVLKMLVSVFNAAVDTRIYVADDAAGTFAEVTGGATLDANLPIEFLAFRDYLFFTNGVDTIQYFASGTTRASCAYTDNDRKGKYIAAAQLSIFLAGDPSNPNTIYMSGNGFYTGTPAACSFPSANAWKIPGDTVGDKIVGIVAARNELIVFRTRDIWLGEGLESATTFTLRKIFDETGSVGQRSICANPYGVSFASEKTVWWLPAGSETPIDIGSFMSTTLRNAVFTSAASGYYATKSQTFINYKTSSAATVNDNSIVLDFKKFKEDNFVGVYEFSIGATAFISNAGRGDNGYFYRLCPATSGATQGLVYRMDTTAQDAGVSFEWYCMTRHHDMSSGQGAAADIKRPMKIMIGMSAQTNTKPADITIYCDRGAKQKSLASYTVKGMAMWGAFVYGEAPYGGGDFQSAIVGSPAGLQGKEIQLKFSKTDALTFKLHNCGLVYERRPMRGS